MTELEKKARCQDCGLKLGERDKYECKDQDHWMMLNLSDAQLIIDAKDKETEELKKALTGIIQCCDGNEPLHEEIYYIAKDTLNKQPK